MSNLITALADLLLALKDVVVSLGFLLLPWIPLFAWVAFWTFGVNWTQLRDVLRKGGWIGVVLIGLVAVLVWGSVWPPARGHYDLLGLRISNFVGKTVYVSGLICLMLLSGSVQLSGACNRWLCFPEDTPEDDHAHGDHGHGDHAHGDHGHSDHGHAPAHH